MWKSVWWRVTAHLTGSLSFLQMRSIQEATRGGTLLGGSYYFAITIETNTLAFRRSRPGVQWHQLSHYSKSWQNPNWTLALWIMPICMSWQKKIRRPPFYDTFYNEQKMGKTLIWPEAVKKKYSSFYVMMENASSRFSRPIQIHVYLRAVLVLLL